MAFRMFVVAFLAVSLAWVAGCSSGKVAVKRQPTHPVTGTVTLDKSPKGGIRVILYPAVEASRDGSFWTQGFPSATTKEDGTYTISTYAQGDGAPVGEYRVLATLMEGEGEQAKDSLKGKYNDPKQSKLVFHVKEQANNLNITLTR